MKLRTIHGARLRERRKKLGLTLKQVADKACTSKSYVWEVENKSYRPSVFHAIKLAHALNTSVEALFDPDYQEGKFNPDYLCQKPQCEANTRAMVKEYSERIAYLEGIIEGMKGK